ncbi:hypothetical protein Nmel_012627 [Mimus melanotis]
MDEIAKVVSQIRAQYGIQCQLKDFTLAVPRLIKLGAIESPDKCTKALAEETISSGSGKALKSWGRVMQTLQKARQEQETWKAARTCLLATPRLGVGAATQTAGDPDLVEHAGARSPQPPIPPPPGRSSPPSEAEEHARAFWGGLTEEARAAAAGTGPETAAELKEKPPPYGFENGAGARDRETIGHAGGGDTESSPNNACVGERGGGAAPEEEPKTNHSAHFKSSPYWARTSPSRRRRDPRGRERPDPRKKGRGRSLRKRLSSPETSGQSTSGWDSDSSSDGFESWSEGGSDTVSGCNKKGAAVYKTASRNAPAWVKGIPEKERTPLTDWRKIKIACAEWDPAAKLVFPVRVGGAARKPKNLLAG